LKTNLLAGILVLAPLGVCLWVLMLLWNWTVVPIGGWTTSQVSHLVPEVTEQYIDGQFVACVRDRGPDGKMGYRPASGWAVLLSRVFKPSALEPLTVKVWVDGKAQTWQLSPEAQRAIGVDPRPVHMVTYFMGFIIVMVIVVAFGVLVRRVLGQALIKLAEQIVSKIPLLKSFYAGTKQLMQTLFSKTERKFKGTVLVQFPRPGMWALAFVTSTAEGELAGSGEETLSVFLPSAPLPTNGFLLMVPKKDVIPLKISNEDAVKYLISGGMAPPGAQAR
jgi:uncharacterized membrane protein